MDDVISRIGKRGGRKSGNRKKIVETVANEDGRKWSLDSRTGYKVLLDSLNARVPISLHISALSQKGAKVPFPTKNPTARPQTIFKFRSRLSQNHDKLLDKFRIIRLIYSKKNYSN